MPNSWSARVADRYRCILSPTMADWFDAEIWKHTGQGEYREPIEPQRLLGEAPDSIWPGLMSCDLLPLINNTAGDWLCVRIDSHNTAGEIVQWYHGGGDWIPWGNDIAEAIVFDACVDRLSGATRRHAVPAEDPRPILGDKRPNDDFILRWALQRLPASLNAILDPSVATSELVQLLMDANVADVALRCELVLSCLMDSTQGAMQQLRADANLSPHELAEWAFDVDRIPVARRSLLERDLGLSLEGRQDWDSAERHSRRVTELAPNLAWAWDIVGYAAERRGDIEAAKESYRRASACSVFTDQSIRLETHWTADESAKFSAARLLHLGPAEVENSTYLSLLCDQDVNGRRSRTTAFWIKEASQFEAAGDFAEAHRCYMAAAWDVGAKPIAAYGELLDCIARTADRSDQPSRAEIARTHRRCLRERYGV